MGYQWNENVLLTCAVLGPCKLVKGVRNTRVWLFIHNASGINVDNAQSAWVSNSYHQISSQTRVSSFLCTADKGWILLFCIHQCKTYNKRVVTHGQQQYVFTYSTHKTSMPNIYFLYVPYNYGHLRVVLSSCHNMDSQQSSSCSS